MIDSPPSRIESAVLVPVFRRSDGQLRVVVVRRGEGGLHGGQLGFPGGRREPDDASLRETALREANEETGLAVDHVRILATLPVIDTVTTGFLIQPFLAWIEPPRRWCRQAGEIAEIIELNVADLARPERRGEELAEFPSWPGPKRIAFFKVGPHKLWGASFRILEPLVPRLLAGDWAV